MSVEKKLKKKSFQRQNTLLHFEHPLFTGANVKTN